MIRNKIKSLLVELNKDIYEKEEVLALALLTALAGESIFLLGDVGIAKSLVARRLKYVFKDATSFEYLMSRFSTPDELFGNISVSKLKNEDKYERIVKNYLPSATVVFLDEIWKASPSIQNSLLTAVNERVYRNGETEIKLPMKALISASNELPARGEGLEALWDRFLLRYIVVGIQNPNNFNSMIGNHGELYHDSVAKQNKITDAEYESIAKGIASVKMPDNIFSVIHKIRELIDGHNEANAATAENIIHVSDRRWKKITRLLKASAFLNDRQQVDLIDCFLIVHCIWDNPAQTNACFKIVANAILSNGYMISFKAIGAIRDGISSINQFLNPEQVATSAPEPEQTAPATEEQSGPATFAGDTPLMMQGYYMIEALELFVAYDDYIRIGTAFTPVTIWELSRGSYLDRGERMFRKVGPCRLESQEKMIKRSPDNILMMKTMGEAPAQPALPPPPAQKKKEAVVAPTPVSTANKIKGPKQCATTIANVRKVIDSQKQIIINHRTQQAQSGATNLFVSHEHNNVVVDCLNNAQRALEQMEIETMKADRQLHEMYNK